MATVFPIVEGDGDVKAVPILLRRIAVEILNAGIEVLQPYRLGRTQLGNPARVGNALTFARGKLRDRSPPQFILLLMDADMDCPIELVRRLNEDHGQQLPLVPTSIVFAVTEFEAWFLAARMSAMHNATLRDDPIAIADSEAVANPKARFRDTVMLPGRAYSETVDQPKYASCMDLATAQRNSPSFDKLVRELRRHLGPQ